MESRAESMVASGETSTGKSGGSKTSLKSHSSTYYPSPEAILSSNPPPTTIFSDKRPHVADEEDATTSDLADYGATTFTCFREMPLELIRMVWAFALPEDIPTIQVYYNIDMQISKPGKDIRLLVPLRAPPTIMAVCAVSREVALKKYVVRDHHGTHRVCYRDFRPDLDPLYIDVHRRTLWPGTSDLFGKVRHLVIPFAAMPETWDIPTREQIAKLSSLQQVTLRYIRPERRYWGWTGEFVPMCLNHEPGPLPAMQLSDRESVSEARYESTSIMLWWSRETLKAYRNRWRNTVGVNNMTVEINMQFTTRQRG